MVYVRTENDVRPLESRCNARKDGRILLRPDAPRIRTKNKKERGRKDNVKVIIIVVYVRIFFIGRKRLR